LSACAAIATSTIPRGVRIPTWSFVPSRIVVKVMPRTVCIVSPHPPPPALADGGDGGYADASGEKGSTRRGHRPPFLLPRPGRSVIGYTSARNEDRLRRRISA